MRYLVYWKRLLDGTISTNGKFLSLDQANKEAKEQNERHVGHYEHWVEEIPDNTTIDVTKASIKVGYFDNEIHKTHVVDTETNVCLCGAEPIGKFVFCCWGASPTAIDCKACRHLWIDALNKFF